MGAVYEEKGWNVTVQWLQTLYRPLIAAATEDFHNSAPSIPAHWHTPSMAPEGSHHQAMLLDYLNYKGEFLASCAHEALDALPLSSIFVFAPNGSLGNDCDKVEIADHIIRYWICSIFVQLNPEMQQATAKAAHLVTVRYAPQLEVVVNRHSLSGSPKPLSTNGHWDILALCLPYRRISKRQTPIIIPTKHCFSDIWIHPRGSKK
jgi:hypothetical protein